MDYPAFATHEDLAARWRLLSPEEESRADALLLDASQYIRAEFKANGTEIDPGDEFQASVLKAVCCSVVRRVMSAPDEVDIIQHSLTAGSFNHQFTYANPSGDIYLTAREYRALGISQYPSKIAQILPKTRSTDE